MAEKKWQLRSRQIREVVHAPDVWAAFDTLRDRPIDDFGLVVEAEPNELGSDQSIPVRTSVLMLRWKRMEDWDVCIQTGIAAGYGDTSAADREAVANSSNR
jgi:hypothetical protein